MDSSSRTEFFAADIVGIVAVVLLAFLASEQLTQSDGDLFAHIALGRWIQANGSLPSRSIISFSVTQAAVFPAWLSAVLFARLEEIGGLALLAAVTAVVAGLTHAMIAGWFVRTGMSGVQSLLVAFVTFALGSSHWLARPHMFSMLFSVVLVLLLETRARWSPYVVGALFAAWSNLHGGWAFGLIVVGCYVCGAAIDQFWRGAADHKPDLRHDIRVLIAAVLGTFINPYFAQLHRAVFASLADVGASSIIDEYRPPGFREPVDIAFYLVLAASALLMIGARRRAPARWLATFFVTAVFALRAGRNIAFFGLVGVPLAALSLLPKQGFDRKTSPESGRRRASGSLFAIVAILVLFVGARRGKIGGVDLIQSEVNPVRFPVSATASLRSSGSDVRLLTTWTWSGYLAFASPGERVFFDPLFFPRGTLDAFGRILLVQPGWRDEVQRSSLNEFLLPVNARLADSLSRDPVWAMSYRDPHAVVFKKVLPVVAP